MESRAGFFSWIHMELGRKVVTLPKGKETIVFQPSIFRCELLVLGRVFSIIILMIGDYTHLYHLRFMKLLEKTPPWWINHFDGWWDSRWIVYGQIIATSHDLGPQKVAFWKGNPLISGKSRLVEYDQIWL